MNNEQRLAAILIKVIGYISTDVNPSAQQVLSSEISFLYGLAYPTEDES